MMFRYHACTQHFNMIHEYYHEFYLVEIDETLSLYENSAKIALLLTWHLISSAVQVTTTVKVLIVLIGITYTVYVKTSIN